MMIGLSMVIAMVLMALAALHLYWGVGGRWPGHDEASMVAHVVGRTRAMQAPGFPACAMVAGALTAAAGLVLARSGVAPGWDKASLIRFGLWGAAFVFVARGIAGYVPGVFAYAAGTPFFDLNLRLYSPLCLALGAGLLAVDHLRAKAEG